MKEKIFVIKPVGARCNLSCEYCYYKNKSKGEKTILDERILEEFLKQYLDLPQAEFRLIWHGGEPTLAGIDFFENVISLQKSYGKRKNISNEIQTNGTLLDEKWIDFFERNQFRIGISIDGPQEIHDRYRKTHFGRGSFEKVMKGIFLLKDSKLSWGALVVLTKKSLGREEQIFEFLIKNKIYSFDLLPVVSLDKKERALDSYSISVEEFIETITKIFNIWWKLDNPNVRIRLFQEMIYAILSEKPLRCFCNSPGCANYFTLNWDGSVYPCEAFMGINGFQFGNILTSSLKEILLSRRYQNFVEQTKKIDSECRDCEWWQICPGRCVFDRYKFGENLAEKDFYCSFRKIFFPYLKKKIREVI